MKDLAVKWVSALLCLLLTSGGFAALWYRSVNAPDEAVQDIVLAAPDWHLAEHRAAGKAYYTLRSDRGNTAWDTRYGNRPASLLFFRLGGDGSLLLQRIDGSVLRLDLQTGDYEEAPVPQEPLKPLSEAFRIQIHDRPVEAFAK